MISPEERQLLQGLFDRIRGAAGTPRDREAEARELLAELEAELDAASSVPASTEDDAGEPGANA